MNTLVFQVDLFSARGALPRDIQDVLARHKDIMYSSRTRLQHRRLQAHEQSGRRDLYKALQKVPEDRLSER